MAAVTMITEARGVVERGGGARAGEGFAVVEREAGHVGSRWGLEEHTTSRQTTTTQQ